MEKQALVSRVYTKSYTKNGSERTLWILVDSDGEEYATQKGSIGEEARQFVDRGALIVYREGQPKDGYPPPKYLDGVRPGHEQQTMPTNNGSAAPTTSKDTMIHRQTASKVAVEYLRYVEENQRTMKNLILTSEMLVDYYARGAAVLGTTDFPEDDIPF